MRVGSVVCTLCLIRHRNQLRPYSSNMPLLTQAQTCSSLCAINICRWEWDSDSVLFTFHFFFLQTQMTAVPTHGKWIWTANSLFLFCLFVSVRHSFSPAGFTAFLTISSLRTRHTPFFVIPGNAVIKPFTVNSLTWLLFSHIPQELTPQILALLSNKKTVWLP